MTEKIILAPGANGSELLKSLALHGVKTINLRICESGELARLALMRSGIAIKENFLSSHEEYAVVAGAMKGVSYFKKPTYSDIQEVTGALRKMRNLVVGTDEPSQIEIILKKGIFTEKNEALLKVYKNYIKALEDNKQIDATGLIRLAADSCKIVDAQFMTLNEYPVSPLERSLLAMISDNRVTETNLEELFEVAENAQGIGNAGDTTDKENKNHIINYPLSIESIKNCYGAPNEVETIINDIYGSGIHGTNPESPGTNHVILGTNTETSGSTAKNLDTCTVAVTDANLYGQLFFDYALLYDIPITFGSGVPIINTRPAQLLVLYYRWMTEGFFGADSLLEMLESKAFNKKKLEDVLSQAGNRIFMQELAGIRFTNDYGTNQSRLDDYRDVMARDEESYRDCECREKKLTEQRIACIPYLEVMARELALPAEEFIRKYANIRKSRSTNAEKLTASLDAAADSAIYNQLSIILRTGIDQTTEDLIKNVLSISICSQKSESGKLHVTGIEKAMSTVRKHMYIAGLSASKYPGSPKEDYLLLDDDIKHFGLPGQYMTSKGRIRLKQNCLMNLVKLCSALGTKIYLSYSGLNVSELKRENASSMIYELIKAESGSTLSTQEMERRIRKVDYFAPAISLTREIGKAYVNGDNIGADSNNRMRAEYAVPWDLETSYSPSALMTFFSCPRRFMLTNSALLGIEEPEEDNPFETISAADLGTLAHNLMEWLANSNRTLNDFMAISEELFDRYMLIRPALLTDSAASEKEAFLEMMESAYNSDPGREVVLAEEDISATHESGVKIHGYPDRVEKLEDDTYLVVDYKTGRHINHIQDDIDTCLQIVIYAYLMEKRGYNVSGCEFRYIRLGETVTCKYDDEMKDALNEKMETFKSIMESGEFPLAAEPEEGEVDPCKYCKCMAICEKERI